MSHLLNWRATCEARFRFDPNRPIPPVEIQRLNLKIATLRNDLSSKLKAGPSTLTNLSAGAQGRYLQLTGQLEIAVRRRAQAQADCRVDVNQRLLTLWAIFDFAEVLESFLVFAGTLAKRALPFHLDHAV